MNRNIKIMLLFFCGVIALILYAYFFYSGQNSTSKNILPQQIPVISSSPENSNSVPSGNETAPVAPKVEAKIVPAPPLSLALERVTKKPFGIKVSPGNSPVSPEKFSGYHTGVDFEILPGEENVDVSVSAVCSGPLVLRKYASGYGGVAVQKCNLENNIVTVIYGHLRFSSIGQSVGDEILSGDNIGVLGKGYSVETDGERKHLHLGIHRGSAVNLLGYVQSEKDLSNWIDAMKYLK